MSSGEPAWDPQQYSRFEAERDRAALDLLLRLPSDLSPLEIWDLGCGAGQHAALLKRRHPDARVHGLDSSTAMLEQAQGRAEDVVWTQGDLSEWTPDRPADLILANASLHWARDHDRLIPRLAGFLAPGGVLAIQMPLRAEPLHHRVTAEVAADGPWAERLAAVPIPDDPLPPEGYHDLLSPLCAEIDIWSTTYLHVLHGPDPVLNWLMGAGLRPHLQALAEDEALSRAFLQALSERLRQAFPPRADGATLLPFPRLFVVARRRWDGAALDL